MKAFPLVVLALLAAGCASDDDPAPSTGANNTTGDTPATLPAVDVAVRVFDQTPGVGVPPTTMGIDPATLELALGVPVNLTLTNDGSIGHNLVIPDLEVETETIDGGATASALFTPSMSGDFEMYCSLGGDGPLGHRAQGMRGTVHVE